MRFAKMEGLYFDRAKARYVVERRVPREIHAIIGGPAKRSHKFSKAVDETTAKLFADQIIRGWEAEWIAALPPIAVYVPAQSRLTPGFGRGVFRVPRNTPVIEQPDGYALNLDALQDLGLASENFRPLPLREISRILPRKRVTSFQTWSKRRYHYLVQSIMWIC